MHPCTVLALDTSSAICSVAVRAASGKIAAVQSVERNTHYETIDELVRSALQSVDITVQELECLVIGHGPGSFTGLRIGFAYAKGLAFVRKIPLRAVSSFHAYACACPPRAHRFAVLADARREEFFAQRFSESAGKIVPHEDVHIVSRQEISTWQNQGCALYEIGTLPTEVEIARGLLALVDDGIAHGETLVSDLASLEPFYLRPVAAKTIADRAR